MEHPLHSSNFPSRTIPCCFAALWSSTSWERPTEQWYSLMCCLLGSCPGAITAQAFSPSAAVHPVAVKAVQVPGQGKHDRTLRFELDYNPRAVTF